MYMPMDMELNIKPLIKELRQKRISIFIPFIQTISFKMIRLRLPLLKNKYGIYESNNSKFNLMKVDMVIIPVLGIDRQFARIGFGKGMYDRFMPTLYKYGQKIKVIFTSRYPIVCPVCITLPFDVVGDCLFSHSAFIQRKYNGNMVCNRKYNILFTSGNHSLSSNKKNI